MKRKFKLPKYKFIFYPVRHSGATNWKDPSPVDYHFGNMFSKTLSKYKYNKMHMSVFFSEYLMEDDRQYDTTTKFSFSEANILLLRHIENKLKDCRKEKARLARIQKRIDETSLGFSYAEIVNKRELSHFTMAAKIYRKKVKEIKQTKEYLWEQLLK